MKVIKIKSFTKSLVSVWGENVVKIDCNEHEVFVRLFPDGGSFFSPVIRKYDDY